MIRLVLALVLIFTATDTALAQEQITIHVLESGYRLNESTKHLNKNELESALAPLSQASVTLKVDYCAGPVAVAQVYVALSRSHPNLANINLVATGNHSTSQCKDE